MEYGLGGRLGTGLVRGKGPCSDDVPTLPWVRSRVWVKVELGSELATGKGWVGTWPVTRLDPVGIVMSGGRRLICLL